MLSPGGFKIVDDALKASGLKKGDRVLDVGCGTGETANYLTEEYGFVMTGTDISLTRIEEATEAFPELDIRWGDGEFMDEFQSYSFDGVLMKCSLSLINLPDEALHEAYCVMKKGGYLLLMDLCRKDPTPEKLAELKALAEAELKKKHEEGDCEDRKQRQVAFRDDGAFYIEPLKDYLEEIGLEVVKIEDRTADMEQYAAETIMKEGSLDGCICNVENRKGLGYFYLVAHKPE